MDPETCFVWDGMNREGDGKIDKEWKFTYCQGVMLGAALEYYRITGEKEQLELAEKIARRAVVELAGEDGIFNYEGKVTAVFSGESISAIYTSWLQQLMTVTI